MTEVQVDARPVAVVRIGLGVAVVLNALEVSVILRRVAEGRLRFPVLDWLPAPTSVAVGVYLAVAVVAGAALVVGYRTSVAAALSSALVAWSLLWDQQTYSNHRVLFMLMTAYLVFARSDAVWSVSRRAHRDLVSWWPQLLMMTQLSACYLFAALSKLNGVYLPGNAFDVWLRVDVPDPLLPFLAIGSIVTELLLAVGLWFGPTRYVAAAAGIGLHLSIVLLMNNDNVVLFAFACACVPAYGLFLTRPAMRPARESESQVAAEVS